MDQRICASWMNELSITFVFSVTSTIVVYPEKVLYQCDYGYEMEPAANPSIKCTESGMYSFLSYTYTS